MLAKAALLFARLPPCFSAQDQEPFVIRSETRAVQINVVAKDKTGEPILGLQRQDFTILDNRQTQPILSFEAVAQSSEASEVILVVDTINTGFDRVAYGREQVEKFLRRDAGKLGVPVSIDFFTDAGLEIGNEPSRDGNYFHRLPARAESVVARLASG